MLMSKECIHFLGPLCIFIVMMLYLHKHTRKQIEEGHVCSSANMFQFQMILKAPS